MDGLGKEIIRKAISGDFSFEAGLSFGYGQTAAPSGASHGSEQRSTTSDVLRAHALVRNPYFGLEAGFMKLPEMHTKFSTRDYPAYKGLPAGSYPQTADVTQQITATAPYAQINAYGPKFLGIEPFLSLGKARVRSDNQSHAIYNDKDENGFRETLKRTANMYGLGLQGDISKNMNWRAEYKKIPRATDGPHTNTRDISMGLIGLGMKF